MAHFSFHHHPRYLEDPACQGLVLIPDAMPNKSEEPHSPSLSHFLSQQRMKELITAAESSASSSTSSSSSSSPLSSLPTALSVVELEDKLARALLACRAALAASVDEDDDEEEEEDDDFEDEEILDAEDDSCESDDVEDEEEEQIKPDDTYSRRMRRIALWRHTIAMDFLIASLPSASPKDLKRKLDEDEDIESVGNTSYKRARVTTLPAHICTACGGRFTSQFALRHHGGPQNTNEACREAVAYEFEA